LIQIGMVFDVYGIIYDGYIFVYIELSDSLLWFWGLSFPILLFIMGWAGLFIWLGLRIKAWAGSFDLFVVNLLSRFVPPAGMKTRF
jgi:hypothetical protein